MGHADTPAAQSAHMLRWRHGSSTTALGRSRQTTHDASPPSSTARGGGPAGSLRAGSALHSPTPVTRAPNGEDIPFWGRSQARTAHWMDLAARLRRLRRAFLRPRNHARARCWRTSGMEDGWHGGRPPTARRSSAPRPLAAPRFELSFGCAWQHGCAACDAPSCDTEAMLECAVGVEEPHPTAGH